MHERAVKHRAFPARLPIIYALAKAMPSSVEGEEMVARDDGIHGDKVSGVQPDLRLQRMGLNQ